MNKTKKYIMMGALVIVTVIGVMIGVKQGVGSGFISFSTDEESSDDGKQPSSSFGFPRSDFISLRNGTHELSDIDLPPGEYAIYAVEGAGTVYIDRKEYRLNSDLLTKTKEETANSPFEGTLYRYMYNKSPKITLKEQSRLVVSGEESFKVSFIKQ